MLNTAIRFPMRYWQGDVSHLVLLVIALPGLRLLVFWLGGLPLVFDIPLLVWQMNGAWHALRRHGHDLFFTLGGFAAMLVTLVLAVLPQIDRLAARNAVPPPPWQPAQTHIEVTGDTIFLSGEIEFPMLDGLRDAVRTGATRLILSSEGGRVYAARGLAIIVAQSGLNTHVETLCASACTLVFAAGRVRSLAEDARLGFHGYGLPSPYPLVDPQEEERKDAATLRARGIDPEFVARIYAVPHTEMWFPARSDLETAGFVTLP